MKLLKTPIVEADMVEVQLSGTVSRHAGKSRIHCEIVQPDVEDTKDEVWYRLKYGTKPDLADAMHSRIKIDKIEFPEDKLILYGVMPISSERTGLWEGQVFECIIDHYEET